MSAREPDDSDGLPDLTAGEYVLGVLDAAESAIVRRRIATEPAFAAEVAGWEERLVPLIDQVAPVTPPASLWEAIAERLQPVRRRPARTPIWENLNWWRNLAMATTALAAASITIVVISRIPPPSITPPPPAAPPALAVAQLANPRGGAVGFVATYDQTRRQLVVTPTGPVGRGDRSPELWLMPEGRPPVSLGVLMDRTLVVEAPAGLNAQSTLGVSLEPLGGSPGGAPTGPVIAVGQLMRL